MKVYKILHKPTGLFFTPSKGYGNLSVKGKIYDRVPNMSWVGGGVRIVIRKWSTEKLNKKEQTIIDYFNIQKNNRGDYWVDSYFPVELEDWEIIEL
jgi:hypothetical protein